MDTETFLIARAHLERRIAQRRADTLAALQRPSSNGDGWGSKMPFWMQLATKAFFAKPDNSFWPKALLTIAPMAIGLARKITHKEEKKSSFPWGAVLGVFPIVKSLIKRYN